MSRLRDIINEIQAHSGKGVQAKLILARIGLKTGINISQTADLSYSDPELEEKLIKAAKEVLKIDIKLDK
ncbi:MAG: hypothetical protein KDK90_08975 [Leptospiraceae bacterium]|nr:hypothetical protein [Leptospiraceae bacterium]